MNTTETPPEEKKLTPAQVDELTEQLSYLLLGDKIPLDVCRASTGEVLVPANRKITKTDLRKVAKSCRDVDIDPSPIRNRVREVMATYLYKQGLRL